MYSILLGGSPGSCLYQCTVVSLLSWHVMVTGLPSTSLRSAGLCTGAACASPPAREQGETARRPGDTKLWSRDCVLHAQEGEEKGNGTYGTKVKSQRVREATAWCLQE